MKHLKSFRIFESSSEEDLLETINDILLPISDSDIKYDIGNLDYVGLIHIEIDGQSEEIDNCVEHLENYLKDLGHEYFIGRSIKDKTHISIENNFNKEIEKDFIKIIDGIKETIKKDYTKSRIWIRSDSNYCLFEQNERMGYLSYDYVEIYSFFRHSHSLDSLEIKEIVRYLVGKYLKLEALDPGIY